MRAAQAFQHNTIVEKQQLTFEKDVLAGLQLQPKRLYSKYFYDAKGDALFQQIMHCPEYYLTRCEMDILRGQSEKIVQAVRRHAPGFDLVELGAGDASKSFFLLKEMLRMGVTDTYFPIDISPNIITQLQQSLPAKLPGLQVQGLNGEYMEMLQAAGQITAQQKLVMFMGSSIGNFTPAEAVQFCTRLRQQLRPGDLVLIGFDLRKNPQTILDAYNDKGGITRAFNLNLLERINRELDGNFDISQFEHYPTYDPVSGACKSFLISKREQAVEIAGQTVRFGANEPVYMEISQKYDMEEINELASRSGFRPVEFFYDSKRWFTDVLWQCR
ncbi:L-histidine N(alpha)-methyltransferase [Chitinophaga sp. GCM10012297]|uniref:L-histidine N(Alpha)-methyltransferase n=1 Tax=Chitinophaga chungangae TaxID=2821488 RepID=A0ABS3Y957_9BACT|nr:L-histidine N(alpha)-methyltransferase [Chitinophaga chungangae]MBO9151222.1 L-histidine N(alpha)-methyltransferase [Chitinophaga chungangae]